ncbi:MAG TPA: hypothetical protein VK943_18360 [Arenibaculum sp.]|nr:hypothetical protein [Arenibaculum sp.]
MVNAIGVKLQDAPVLQAQAPQLTPAQGAPGQADSATMAGAALTAGGPYYSPVVRLDPETQRTVILFRDAGSGKVQVQYPSERQLEAYRASIRQQQGQERDTGDEPGRIERADDGATGRDGDDAAVRDTAAFATGQPSAATDGTSASVAVAVPDASSVRTAVTV